MLTPLHLVLVHGNILQGLQMGCHSRKFCLYGAHALLIEQVILFIGY
jgi:hypothetical protein